MNRTAILLFLFVWAAGCGKPTDLVSKECGVTITMPARPIYEPSTSVIAGDNITNHQYRALRDGITYGFVCIPVAKLMEGHEAGEALDSVREGFLNADDKGIVSEHDLSLQSIPGREFVMKRAPDMQRNRVYLFPNSMVYTWVISSEAGIASPAADRFFDSLRVASR
jgi:hypothetical protein